MIALQNQSESIVAVVHEPTPEILFLVKQLVSALYPSSIVREVDYGD